MPHVERSPAAEQDLFEIGVCIAEQSGNEEIAYRFLDTIDETVGLLARYPEMGELREEFATGLYRSFTVGNYVIFYRPISSGIQVARVLHGARDHRSLL
ncbi:MAG: type II toxin-antitoxin system RelE/ParE family toxin [Planctomycetes bacterium]|nr:type II toxin-antitoxin system RelE/ParE family toxin [Planctomycetota bacterium]